LTFSYFLRTIATSEHPFLGLPVFWRVLDAYIHDTFNPAVDIECSVRFGERHCRQWWRGFLKCPLVISFGVNYGIDCEVSAFRATRKPKCAATQFQRCYE